jgi:hypothetical protein
LLEKGSDAAPEEANGARLSEEERDAVPNFGENSHEARRSRLGAQGVAIHAEHCAARGAPARTSTRRSTSLRTPEPIEDRWGFLDWVFCSRKTGPITLVQLPDWQFAVWLLGVGGDVAGAPWGWVRVFLASPRFGGPRALGRGRGVGWGEPPFVASWDWQCSWLSSPW